MGCEEYSMSLPYVDDKLREFIRLVIDDHERRGRKEPLEVLLAYSIGERYELRGKPHSYMSLCKTCKIRGKSCIDLNCMICSGSMTLAQDIAWRFVDDQGHRG